MNYFKAKLLGFKRWHLKSNQNDSGLKSAGVCSVSFKLDFTLLNSHCSGYHISFSKNVFKNFPCIPLLCLECFSKLHNLRHSSKKSFCTSKAEYEWIYVTKNRLQWILSLGLVNKTTLQVSKAQTSLISLLSTPF